ncbi:MAG: SdrD B-like domain-containing protein [Candidatus Krumholzibacteriia bacterium]
MKRSTRSWLLLLPLAVLLATWCGCSENGTVPPAQPDPVLVAGTVTDGGVDFTIEVSATGDPASPRIGPFLLRGSDLRRDESGEALLVDLTIQNLGQEAHPLPVGLVFHEFRPRTAVLLNPINEIHGPGARILFDFLDRDLVWSPGEESLPFTARFAVGPGESMAFVAEVEIGDDPMTGRISGLVWHDADENGRRDPGEPGVPGIALGLRGYRCAGDPRDDQTGDSGATADRCIYVTDETGRYRIEGLPAGMYTVYVMPRDGMVVTTAPELNVLLVPENGGVSDFDDAWFGVARLPSPGFVLP